MTQKVTLVKAESPGSPEIPLNVDSSGNIGVNVESGGSGGGSGGVVQVSDGTTKTQYLAVDANGKIGVNALPSITGATTNDVLTNVYGTTAVPADWSKYLAIKSQALQDAWDSTNHNLQVTSDNDIWVNNLTVPAGSTMSLASGQEFTCGALDNSGTIVNMGYLRCTSFTTEAGSTYISGPGSVKEVFAGY